MNLKLKKFFLRLKKEKLKYIFFLLRKNFLNIFIFLLTIPICIVIILIYPIIFLRFGSLCSDKIGPFSAIPEMNLCEQETGLQPKNTLNIYSSSHTGFICNSQLFKMWKRKFTVQNWSSHILNAFNYLPFGKKHIIFPNYYSRDIHGLLNQTKTHLKFTKSEIEHGEREVEKMGLKNKKFILMINRGSRYLKEIYDFKIDFSYHSYRNSPILDYMPAAEQLTKKNYHVVRVGHLVDDKIESSNEKIIDYDNSGLRTDFLDIYLSSKCEYIFGTDTGFVAVPGWNFRKPVLYVNFSQLEYLEPWLPSWLMIFKKYWLINEKRFMKIDEIIKSGYGRFHETNDFKKVGVELINNTPSEVTDVNLEMEKRINGRWEETEEDLDLQKKFWSNFEKSKLHGNFLGKIGSDFLKENKNLFLSKLN